MSALVYLMSGLRFKQNGFIFGVSAIIILFFLSVALPLHALTLSPLRQTIVVQPGHQEIVRVKVKNDSAVSVTAIPEVEAFTIDSRTGQAVFGAVDEAVNWIALTPVNLSLKPGEERSAFFTISVPTSTLPRSHYLGLFIKQASEGGQVSANTRLGSLLFLHIAGHMNEQLAVSLDATEKWQMASPPRLVARMRNDGTIHLIPKGKVAVFNWRGKLVQEFTVNPANRKILPGGEWEENYAFSPLSWASGGPLSVKLNGQYGLTEQVLNSSLRVWYLPISTIAGVAVAIGSLGGLIFFLKKRNRI